MTFNILSNPDKRKWVIVATIFVAIICNYLDRQLLSILKPEILEHYNITNLEYADISNFDLTKTTRAQYLFQNCKNLKYINLKNVIVGNSTNLQLIFDGTSEDFTYCINSNPLITKELKNKSW